jgi:hypothetical protein
MERKNLHRYPYFQYLEECNGIGGGCSTTWRFYPGMTYGSREKWWPDTGARPTPHEGIDICYYTDKSGRERQFGPSTRVPAMTTGTVIALCDDFLGRSVFLEHYSDNQERLISIYAHIVPHQRIFPGLKVAAGEEIGTVADTVGRKNRMPAHLHITIMKRPPAAYSGVHLDWEYICNAGRVCLVDPFAILFCPSCMIMPRIDSRPAIL